MPESIVNQPVVHTGLTGRLREFYRKYMPSPLVIIGIGVVGYVALGRYYEHQQLEASTRFYDTLELALQQHGDANGDGIVTRAERD